MRPRAATTSVALHVVSLLALWMLHQASLPPLRPKPEAERLFTPLAMPRPAAQRAGGGQREATSASKGRLPPRPKTRVFILPTAHPLNDQPVLTLPQAIPLDDLTTVPEVDLSRIGSPFGKDGPASGGRGGPGGIGDGVCCGVGDDRGNTVGGAAPRRSLSSPPILLYKVEPEYSDEARKAKVQGVVVIMAEVDASGRIRKIMVVQPLGLGLDERAAAAAEKWRFRPATAGGQPVSTSVTIEVNFRLL